MSQKENNLSQAWVVAVNFVSEKFLVLFLLASVWQLSPFLNNEKIF